MTTLFNVFYVCSWNTLVDWMLSDFMFAQVVTTTFSFAKASRLDFGFCFSEAKSKGIGADRTASHFRLSESVDTWRRHLFMVKTMLRCAIAIGLLLVWSSGSKWSFEPWWPYLCYSKRLGCDLTNARCYAVPSEPWQTEMKISLLMHLAGPLLCTPVCSECSSQKQPVLTSSHLFCLGSMGFRLRHNAV